MHRNHSETREPRRLMGTGSHEGSAKKKQLGLCFSHAHHLNPSRHSVIIFNVIFSI